MKPRKRFLVSILGALLMLGQLSPAQAADQARQQQRAHVRSCDPDLLPIDLFDCVALVDGVLLTLDGLDDLIPDVVDPWQLLDDLDVLLGDDCGKPDVGLPYKSAKYTVAVDGIETCDSNHNTVSIGLILQIRKGGTWHTIGSDGSVKTDDDDSGPATATGACTPDTNRKYRGYGDGGPTQGSHFKAGDVIRIGCPTAAEIIADPLP